MINNDSLRRLGLQPMQLNSSFQTSSETIEQKVGVSDLNQEQAMVFVGSGLSAIWELEDNLEWRLLTNILDTFQLCKDNLVCFDTEHLQTEESIGLTLDEIVEMGCEVVYSFDEDGEFLDLLKEGVDVILLPSLADQLSSWRAKKQCYQTLVSN